MMDNFAVMIVTHGRPDNQLTVDVLKSGNYTGKIWFIVDDEDETLEQYKIEYGEENVKVFHKVEWFDIGDNFYNQKNSSVYARNECFRIAEKEGLKYFLEMDDDFTEIVYRYECDGKLKSKKITDFDGIFKTFCEFLDVDSITCLAFGVNGDGIGGLEGNFKKGFSRKCRNTFFCKVSKPFEFKGRFEDVVTPAYYNSIGKIFMTITTFNVGQMEKEKNKGGMSEMKSQNITFWEFMYPVMYMPSAIKISRIDAEGNHREHVSWNNVIPKILNERYKKA